MEGVTDAKVDVVWEPGWTKDRMSDVAETAAGDVVRDRMLRLSKKADYALMAMKHLARKTDSAASTSAREIAEQYDIPIELMAKVLQRLARSGLLTSHQGTRGGYTLSQADRVDLGGRHHPGDRRPADRDRLLDRRRAVRAVH